jgi:hypothetical protein
LAAGFVLAPPLGGLIEPEPLNIWPYRSVRNVFAPEPTELTRFPAR